MHARVLVEELRWPAPQPAVPQRRSRRGSGKAAGSVDDLTEEGYPRLGPKGSPEDKGRVRTHPGHGSACQMRGVQRARKPLRRNLQVALQRRHDSLGCDALHLGREPLDPVDFDAIVRSIARERRAENCVTHLRRERQARCQVVQSNRGKSPDQHWSSVELGGRAEDPVEPRLHRPLDSRKRVALECHRRRLELDAESMSSGETPSGPDSPLSAARTSSFTRAGRMSRSTSAISTSAPMLVPPARKSRPSTNSSRIASSCLKRSRNAA